MNVHSPIPLHDTHSYETRYRAEDPWDVPDSQVPLLLTQVFPWGRKHGFSKLKTYTDRKMVGGDLYLNQLVAGKHESDLGTPMPQVTVMAIKKTSLSSLYRTSLMSASSTPVLSSSDWSSEESGSSLVSLFKSGFSSLTSVLRGKNDIFISWTMVEQCSM